MSEFLTSLCSELLNQYFGEVVEKVGTHLMRQVSACPIRQIVDHVSLPREKVVSALRVLIQHNFCEFTLDERDVVEYNVNPKSILMLIYYPRFIYYAKTLCGDPGELLVEEVLENGKLTMSAAIQKVAQRLHDEAQTNPQSANCTLEEVKTKFVALVEHNFICRCPCPRATDVELIPKTFISDRDMYILPQIQLQLLHINDRDDDTNQPARKNRKIEFPDAHIYWKVNFNKFKEFFRAQAIVTACKNSKDEKAGEIVKMMFLVSESRNISGSDTTIAISRYEIMDGLKKETKVAIKELDPYLTVLCEGEESFISKANDNNGGMFAVNIKKSFQRIAEATAACVVEDRFGVKAARIFRMLLIKKYLEQKKIEELAMMPPKEVRELMYKMFKENFISNHEVPKGLDFSASRGISLFHVDVNQATRMLLERCYQAVYNSILCCKTHMQNNKRVLDKKERVDTYVANLKQSGADDAQIEEYQQIITPPEKAVLERVREMTKKLNMAQVQLADMILTLSIWLEMLKK